MGTWRGDCWSHQHVCQRGERLLAWKRGRGAAARVLPVVPKGGCRWWCQGTPQLSAGTGVMQPSPVSTSRDSGGHQGTEGTPNTAAQGWGWGQGQPPGAPAAAGAHPCSATAPNAKRSNQFLQPRFGIIMILHLNNYPLSPC